MGCKNRPTIADYLSTFIISYFYPDGRKSRCLYFRSALQSSLNSRYLRRAILVPSSCHASCGIGKEMWQGISNNTAAAQPLVRYHHHVEGIKLMRWKSPPLPFKSPSGIIHTHTQRGTSDGFIVDRRLSVRFSGRRE